MNKDEVWLDSLVASALVLNRWVGRDGFMLPQIRKLVDQVRRQSKAEEPSAEIEAQEDAR